MPIHSLALTQLQFEGIKLPHGTVQLDYLKKQIKDKNNSC